MYLKSKILIIQENSLRPYVISNIIASINTRSFSANSYAFYIRVL